MFAINLFYLKEKTIGLVDYDFMSGNVMYFILLSCLLAFLVNLSIFLTIGKTSPITYNVLGHFKLCVVTIGGTLIFNEDTNPRKITGVAVALFGITMYTYWKLQTSNAWEKREKKLKASQSSSTNAINGGSGNTTNGGDVTVNLLEKKASQ